MDAQHSLYPLLHFPKNKSCRKRMMVGVGFKNLWAKGAVELGIPAAWLSELKSAEHSV